MSVTTHLTSVLTFNKEGMADIANDESATMWAFIIALIGSIIGFLAGLIAFMELDPLDYGSPALYELAQDLYMTSAVTALVTTVVMLFVFAGIMAFVLRGFGGTATLIQCLRVFGFTQIFSVIGSFINLVLALGNISFGLDIGGLLGLLGLVAFIIGLTSFSGLSLGSAVIAAIIAFILAIIVVAIVVMIIAVILVVALLSAFA